MSAQVDATGRESSQPAFLQGETVLATLPADDGEFRMTSTRMVFVGGGETVSVYASALLRDVVGVDIIRRPRESRSAWWGGIGLLAAIGVWEVSSSATVGGIAAVVVALISLALLVDYWFRPGGVLLAFRTAGSTVQGIIESPTLDAARQFVADFERIRAHARQDSFGPTAGYGLF